MNGRRKNSCLCIFLCLFLFHLPSSIVQSLVFLIAAEGVMPRGDSPSHVTLLDDELPFAVNLKMQKKIPVGRRWADEERHRGFTYDPTMIALPASDLSTNVVINITSLPLTDRSQLRQIHSLPLPSTGPQTALSGHPPWPPITTTPPPRSRPSPLTNSRHYNRPRRHRPALPPTPPPSPPAAPTTSRTRRPSSAGRLLSALPGNILTAPLPDNAIRRRRRASAPRRSGASRAWSAARGRSASGCRSWRRASGSWRWRMGGCGS